MLAWYHGDRREQRIRGTELAMISMLFLVVGGIFWLYDRGREPTSEIGAAQYKATGCSPEPLRGGLGWDIDGQCTRVQSANTLAAVLKASTG